MNYGPYDEPTEFCKYKSKIDGKYYNGYVCSPDRGRDDLYKGFEELAHKLLEDLNMNEQEILNLCCDELGIERARITDKDGFRWTIAYDNPWFSIQMLKLEKLLHEKTTRPIDLRSEVRADKNKRAERNGRQTNGEKLEIDKG